MRKGERKGMGWEQEWRGTGREDKWRRGMEKSWKGTGGWELEGKRWGAGKEWRVAG